jgi:hypothetical protein
MTERPSTADGYAGRDTELVRSTCLYIATVLGDLVDDFVIVGGLVPTLLVAQDSLPEGERHPGTLDLDVGLSLSVLEKKRYTELAARLRRAGFHPDKNEQGNPTFQRWTIEEGAHVQVDFLIPPVSENARGGELHHLERDLAAVTTPGLHLAFHDRQKIALSGRTLLGESAARDLWVCGAGAFVVLKALAFGNRGEGKDAFDLYYVIRKFGSRPEDVAARMRPLLSDRSTRSCIQILQADFVDGNAGPLRVSRFLSGEPSEEIVADVTGFVRRFLNSL